MTDRTISPREQVRERLNAVGITIRYSTDFRDYRVNFRGGAEATAYYTPDLNEALYTGLDMANRGAQS